MNAPQHALHHQKKHLLAARQQQRGGFALGMVAGLLVGLALALGVALYITKAPIPFVNKVPQRTAEQDTAETERNRSWDPNAPLGGKNAPRSGAGASADGSGAGSTAGTPTPVPSVTQSATPSVLPPGIATAPAVVQGTGPAATSPASAPSPAKNAKDAAKDPAAILAGGAAPPSNSPAPAGVTSTAPALEAFVYFVQAGAYSRSEEAEQQRARLALMGQTAKITEREQAGRTMYRVRVGPFASRDPADALQSKLQDQSIESQIVRVERP